MDDFISIVPVQAIESPCVNICRIAGGRCIGCKRTLDEIARWTSMGVGDRARVTAALAERD